VVLVPQHEKKLVADIEMTKHLKAVSMIKTDFFTIKVALGSTAKSAWLFCLEMGLSRRKMVGEK
jgi:hypothetical protein